jgi:PhoPQ-activated pathogenicity-related protein
MAADICEAAFGSVPKTAGFVGFDASKRVARRDQLPSGTLAIFQEFAIMGNCQRKWTSWLLAVQEGDSH